MRDIPGAFLHADMDQDIHMLLEGTIAEPIVKLEPKLYRKYIWRNKNDKPMLNVKLKGPIWDTAGGTAFLEATQQYTERMGVHNQ